MKAQFQEYLLFIFKLMREFQLLLILHTWWLSIVQDLLQLYTITIPTIWLFSQDLDYSLSIDLIVVDLISV